MSQVQNVIEALSSFEEGLNNIKKYVSESKQKIRVELESKLSNTSEEILAAAKEEAKKIISNARNEAEEEAKKTIEKNNMVLVQLRKRMDEKKDQAVSLVISKLLGEI